MTHNFTTLKSAVSRWIADKGPRLGAALAFYSVLSLAPLLLLVVAIAGLVFERDAARQEVVEQMRQLVGKPGADAVETMMKSADEPTTGIVASVVGLVTLLFGAAGVFGELQDAMNSIWRAKPKSNHWFRTFLKDRLFSFSMVLGTGFLLMVSLVVSAALHALQSFLNISAAANVMFFILNLVVSLVIFAGLFTLIFKFVPDAKVPWGPALLSGFVTAVLFSVGKFLLGAYLGRASFMSPYGAAGSFVVVIVWVYYSAQILYFGAELSYTLAHGRRTEPEPVSAQSNESSDRLEIAGVH
jgi:membrane protein